MYCSDACLRGLTEIVEIDALLVPPDVPPRRAPWWLAAGIVVGGSFVVVQSIDHEPPPPTPIVVLSAAHAAVAVPAPPTAAELERAEQAAQDEALLHELAEDAWIHPLAGPKRRMPVNHTAAFGAERQVDPRPECLSGHCGVDVGDNWGEPIHAVHDGVVDWVNRGPNEEHGGVFVKVAHRGGQLYSWYFHLAAVPRWVQPGVRISVGQVIGLLGDTGIKRSVPHLHFAMTVKRPGTGRERYIDPEPLIALWPLWILDAGKGHMSTAEAVGVPVREPPRKRPASRGSPGAGAAQNDNEATEPIAPPRPATQALPAAALPASAPAPILPSGRSASAAPATETH